MNNKWALKNFEEWFKAKRSTTEEPLNVLLTDDPAVLCETLNIMAVAIGPVTRHGSQGYRSGSHEFVQSAPPQIPPVGIVNPIA